MTIQELNTKTVTGKIEIKLKDGEILIGCIPCDTHIANHLIFLPHKFSEEYYSKFIAGQTYLFEDMLQYVRILERGNIESFELLEHKINDYVTENNKPIPDWFQLRFTNNDTPGYVFTEYKLPEYEKFFELGYLKIKNGIVIIPITFVFLSYAKEDKAEVINVMNKLHENGVMTWFDEKNLLPGDDWEVEIENSIEKADYVFIFLSSKTIDKVGYKNKEFNYALNQHLLRPTNKRYIIPILLDDCNPPREFKKIHWIKTSELNWFNKILLSIGKEPNQNPA